MSVYQIDPLTDPRWLELLERNPKASVFHLPGWLRALRATYGYRPVAWTTTPPGHPLQNGIVFCRVKSWITGSRLVSLPFSDYCQPLVRNTGDLQEILGFLESTLKESNCRYLELRPLSDGGPKWTASMRLAPSAFFQVHWLDLKPSLNSIFGHFHASCVKRKIHRAEREHLVIEEGRSPNIARTFYQLLLRTRRRHGLPPQPFQWFLNLLDAMGEHLLISVARKGSHPVAGILTLSFKNTIVYKYGCSDAQMHNLGGMQYLFWKAIQGAKGRGVERFEFGRTELENGGLMAFKERLGSSVMPLVYYRYPERPSPTATKGWRDEVPRRVFSRLPNACLAMIGNLLYRHVG